MDIRRHPHDSRLPLLSDRVLLYLASWFARIDAFHHMDARCWVALVECAHDEMMGRKHLIPVADWVALPNVVGRYLARYVASGDSGRVELSYRCCPEHRRTIRFDLEIDGAEVWERGVHARAFRSETEAEAWLRDAEA